MFENLKRRIIYGQLLRKYKKMFLYNKDANKPAVERYCMNGGYCILLPHEAVTVLHNIKKEAFEYFYPVLLGSNLRDREGIIQKDLEIRRVFGIITLAGVYVLDSGCSMIRRDSGTCALTTFLGGKKPLFRRVPIDPGNPHQVRTCKWYYALMWYIHPKSEEILCYLDYFSGRYSKRKEKEIPFYFIFAHPSEKQE